MLKKTLVSLAAALLAAKMAGASGFSAEELEHLDDLVDAQDVGGIHKFAAQAKDLPAGDPLAVLLQEISRENAFSDVSVDVAWNVRLSPRSNRFRGGGNKYAWHWRPTHRFVRGLHFKKKRRPPIY